MKTPLCFSEFNAIGVQVDSMDRAQDLIKAYRPAYLFNEETDRTVLLFKRPANDCNVKSEVDLLEVDQFPPVHELEATQLMGNIHLLKDFPVEWIESSIDPTVEVPELPTELLTDPFGRVPLEMKSLAHWVLWRYELREGGGKPTKVPYQPNGDYAKCNTPNTWSSFEVVSTSLEGGCFDGIGFCFSDQDGLSGVDLDGCFDPATGAFTKPEAKEIVERAVAIGAYVEISPSGSGFRIFVRGSLPRSGKAKGSLKWIEGYDYKSPRYLTVTGNVFPKSGSVIVEAQSFLDWFHGRYLKVPKAEIKPAQFRIETTEVDDDILIAEIRRAPKDGPRFTQLFDKGLHIDSATGEVLDDHSAADFALCGLLARWTERNAEQMDRIFRRSALIREKWDEVRGAQTYGELTIANAINACEQTRQEWIEKSRIQPAAFVESILSGEDLMATTTSEFAIALYQADNQDGMFLRRMESLGYFKKFKITKQVLQKTLISGKRFSQDVAEGDDHPPELIAAFDEINLSYCVAWMGGGLNVLKHVVSEEHLTGGYVPVSKADLKGWYANKTIEVENPASGRIVRVNPVDRWWNSDVRAEYDAVEFAPGKSRVITNASGRILNLWGGWAVEPTEGDITPFLQIVERVICSGDTKMMGWLLDWLAHIFQHPACLPSTAVLFRGGQGWGKNSVIDTVAKCLGSSFLQVSSTKQLTGDFNAHLADKLLIHGAESVWGGDKSKVGNLKAMITDEFQAIEHKGRDVFQVRNYKRLMLSSNETWPIPMDMDDRRFVVFTNRQVWGTGDSFWADFRKWRGDQGHHEGVSRILGFLLDRDISEFKPWAKPEDATDGWDLKIKNSDPLTQWWYAMLRDGDIQGFTVMEQGSYGSQRSVVSGEWTTDFGTGYALAVRRHHFWGAFSEWRKSTGTHGGIHEADRKPTLKKLCPSMKERQVSVFDRAECFVFPPLDQCRKEFADAFKTPATEIFSDEVEHINLEDLLANRIRDIQPKRAEGEGE